MAAQLLHCQFCVERINTTFDRLWCHTLSWIRVIWVSSSQLGQYTGTNC